MANAIISFCWSFELDDTNERALKTETFLITNRYIGKYLSKHRTADCLILSCFGLQQEYPCPIHFG